MERRHHVPILLDGKIYKLVLFFVGVIGDVLEYHLIQNLTTNYDVNVRPVSDYTSTVKVYIGLALSQIVDLVISYFVAR